jgi:hypothetical protein
LRLQDRKISPNKPKKRKTHNKTPAQSVGKKNLRPNEGFFSRLLEIGRSRGASLLSPVTAKHYCGFGVAAAEG